MELMLTSHKVTKVGAVVVNWNAGDHLRRCIAALGAQDVPFDKIVIIDNGNSIPPGALQFPSQEKVQYLRLPYNAGFAKANNMALGMLKDYEWVALVNPDAFLETDWLGKMLAAATVHPEFSSFAGQLVMFEDRPRLDGTGDIYHVSGLVWRRGHGTLRKECALSEEEVFSPCAAAALYRSDAFTSVGGFDEDFFCYVEDVDVGFRLRLAGHRCMFVAGAVAYHVGSVTTGGKHSDFAIYHGHRNLVWTFIKNMPGALFWILLPLHLAMNVFTVAHVSLRGKSRVILRSKWDAIKGIRMMWRKRRQIQASRVVSIRQIWHMLDKRFTRNRNAVM